MRTIIQAHLHVLRCILLRALKKSINFVFGIFFSSFFSLENWNSILGGKILYYLWMVNILLLCFLEFYAKHKSNRARFNLDCSSYYCLEFFYGTKFTMFYMRVNSLWFILKVFFQFYEKFMCGMETTALERLLTFSFSFEWI